MSHLPKLWKTVKDPVYRGKAPTAVVIPLVKTIKTLLPTVTFYNLKPPSPKEGEWIHVRINPGDTPQTIVEKYGMTLEEFKYLNQHLHMWRPHPWNQMDTEPFEKIDDKRTLQFFVGPVPPGANEFWFRWAVKPWVVEKTSFVRVIVKRKLETNDLPPTTSPASSISQFPMNFGYSFKPAIITPLPKSGL